MDRWVYNTELPSDETGTHTLYDPTKSSNWKELDGYTFDINYVGGTGASGIVGTDTVDVGGAIVPNQPIELATSVGSAVDSGADGVLALGFKGGNSGMS